MAIFFQEASRAQSKRKEAPTAAQKTKFGEGWKPQTGKRIDTQSDGNRPTKDAAVLRARGGRHVIARSQRFLNAPPAPLLFDRRRSESSSRRRRGDRDPCTNPIEEKCWKSGARERRHGRSQGGCFFPTIWGLKKAGARWDGEAAARSGRREVKKGIYPNRCRRRACGLGDDDLCIERGFDDSSVEF